MRSREPRACTRARHHVGQAPAGRLGYRRRFGRCRGGAPAADVTVGIDPRHARSGCAGARQRRAGLPVEPAMRGEGAGTSEPVDRSDLSGRAGAAGQSARGAFDRGCFRALGRCRSRAARRLARGSERSRGGGDRAGAAVESRARWLGRSRARPCRACPVRVRPASRCSRASMPATPLPSRVPREWWRLATFLR